MTLALTALAALLLALAHLRAGARRLRGLAAALLVVDALAFAAAWVAVTDGPRWRAWTREDGPVEWATFFLFAAAALLEARSACRSRGARRLLAAGLALFCVFVAGEEISWGQRLFAFEPPAIFLEENFQQELNVHNLVMDDEIAGFSLESRNLVALVALLWGVLGAAARAAAPRRLDGLGPAPGLAGAFALVAAAEVGYPVDFTGEVAECALGFLFASDAVLRPSGGGRGAPAVAVLALGALVLGVATPVVLERTIFGSDEERSAEARAELERLAADLARPGATTPKLRKRQRVHKRVFTAVRKGYLRVPPDGAFLEGRPTPADRGAEGEPRRDRRGYFVDPWSNPYWVLWEKDDGRVILYSFGPNRRRDTDTRPFRGFGGDDVGVVVGDGR